MVNDSKKNNLENFQVDTDYSNNADVGYYNNYLNFHLICMIFSFFLILKCNNFNIGGIMLAVFCPVIYILYYFATDKCMQF